MFHNDAMTEIKLLRIQIDCRDPESLSRFWAEYLKLEEVGRMGTPPHYVALGSPTDGGPRLCFQRVPEPKSGKNRLHLDLLVSEMEKATDRAVTLGARPVEGGDFHEGGIHWRVMADPEGNEFCIEEP